MRNMFLPKLTSLLLCVVTLLGIFTGCTDTSRDAYEDIIQSFIQDSYSDTSGVTEEESLESQTESSQAQSTSSVTETIEAQSFTFSFDDIPVYSNKAFVALNGNTPVFSKEELSAIGTEKYSPLDSLGRCGPAFAVCGTEIMPASGEKRGSISHIKPTGWVQAQYDSVDGKYLYNRCHLLGWQLSAENDNKSNLITGTRYMNTQGMLPFENMIADYIEETGNHVAYRVTPRFQGSELVARGVQLEAYSVEDQGEGICFHVYVYNVQPGITITYKNGKSKAASTTSSSPQTATPSQSKVSSVETSSSASSSKTVYITPTGKRYHYSSTCGGKNSKASDLETAKSMGLTPCKKCAS